MIIRFKTKKDINGNTYYLIVDFKERTYTKDYNCYPKDGDITTTRKEMRELIIFKLAPAGFEEI